MIRNHLGPWWNRLNYFRIRFQFRRYIRSHSSKNSTPRCAWHRGVKILGLANKKNVLHIFSFMIDVFIPKWISPDCPSKSNQRLSKISIMTPQCVAHCRFFLEKFGSVDSAEGCTPRSLTPCLCITPRSQTTSKMSVFMFSVFVFSNSWRLSTTFYRKTSEVKKIP